MPQTVVGKSEIENCRFPKLTEPFAYPIKATTPLAEVKAKRVIGTSPKT